MAGTKATFVTRNRLLLTLTGGTVLYQIVFQAKMFSILQKEVSLEEECVHVLEGLEGAEVESPRCMEVKLFREWEDAAPSDLEVFQYEIAAGDRKAAGSTVSTTANPNMKLSHEIVLGEVLPLSWGHDTEEEAPQQAPQEENTGESLASTTEPPLLDRIQQFEHDLCSQPEHKKHSTCLELEANLAAKERARHLEARLARAARRSKVMAELAQAARHDDVTEELQGRHADLEASLSSISGDHAAWQRKFEERSADLEAQIATHSDSHAAWEHEFEQKARRLHQELCQDPARRERPDCVHFLATVANATSSNVSSAPSLGAGAIAPSGEEWSRTFMEAVHKAQEEMCSEPQRRERADCVELMAALKKNADNLLQANFTAALGDSAQWSRTFRQTVRAAQKEMCAEPHRRERADCVELMTSIERAERREAHLQELREQSAALEAQFQKVADDHAEWERGFQEKVRQAHKEMCEQPMHKDHPDCKEFLSSGEESPSSTSSVMMQAEEPSAPSAENVADASAAAGDKEEDSDAWSHEFMRMVRKTEREMCNEPQRRDREDCVQLVAAMDKAEKDEAEARRAARAQRAALREDLAREGDAWKRALDDATAQRTQERQTWEKTMLESYGLPAVNSTPPSSDRIRTSLRQGRRQLHWSAVSAWAKGSWLPSFANKRVTTVERTELQAARWAGMIPKVACVTGIPAGRVTRENVLAFIHSFHDQKYEGPSQLLLVYHYKDTATAEIVRMYADGFNVKAIAARDEGEFPSTTALRFGAWKAAEDAQVVAQWDFDATHHLDQLSLQVRALAYSSRPVSLVREQGVPVENSMVGEASWMKRNWYPLLDKEHGAEDNVRHEQLVEVSLEEEGA